MEQENVSNINNESGKAPNSKKILIFIIIILSAAVIILATLFVNSLIKNSQKENETVKNNTPANEEVAKEITPNVNPPANGTATAVPVEVKKADLYVKNMFLVKNQKWDLNLLL
ncbi:MAG TPA: hypothetical protein P5548_02405 [Candidatus Moranbacteria bacterium]|nr:hypothetical protein [Candidatus Moranbacteria bacterium]HRZ33720.1 hypothetical protein [Candidatus Moranbacteria bacterium]